MKKTPQEVAEEMARLIREYKGPITKCPSGCAVAPPKKFVRTKKKFVSKEDFQ